MTREEKILAKMKQYSKTPTMSKKTEEELRVIAEKAVNKQEKKSEIKTDDSFKFSETLLRREDVVLADELLEKYLRDFTVETQADKSTLLQLIKLEVWDKRLGEKLENVLEGTHGASISPLMKTLHENLNQIRTLKETLGLTNQGQESAASYIQKLLKRGKIWSEELSKADRTFICQHCSKPNLLLFKINQYDPIKHPFFQGRYITNHKIIQLYIDGKITEADVGEIFDVAKQDYIQWTIKKFYNKEHLEKIKNTQEKYYNKKFIEDNHEETPNT